MNPLRWFTQTEIEAALAKLTTIDRARAITSEIGIRAADQMRTYAWTLEGLLLMEHASEDCRRRVETRVRDVPDATLAPYRLAWRESIEAGRTIDLGVEDFVVPAD